MPNDKFCVRPFVHSLVDTRGDYKPCCRATVDTGYNINQHSIKEWWQGSYLTDLRQRMIDGKDTPECWRCQRQEEQGVESFRQQSNRQWPLREEDLPTGLPLDWEIQITNLCNLRCLMCNPASSSQVLAEDKKIFGIADSNRDYEWNPDSEREVRKMFETGTSFVIRGGEPFMVPYIKPIIARLQKKKKFLFNTNATCFDDEWTEILSRHDVKMSISIDGFNQLNHYIRYPSDWSDIVSNLHRMRQISGVNMFLNTCVQNLNVLHLDDLLVWAVQGQGLYVNLDVLTKPEFLEPSCLPHELAQEAVARLEDVKKIVDVRMIRGLDGVIGAVKNNSTDRWQEFQDYINAKDAHRGLSIIDYIPEMEPYFAKTT